MPPLTPGQRQILNQFIGLTGVPEKTAQRLLKAANWKIENASDSYFAANGAAPSVSSTDSLQKLFDSYRDAKNDEPDTIGVEGTMRYFNDLEVDLENASMLVPMEIVQAPTVGEISKEGFINGWRSIGKDTISSQKAYVAAQVKRLGTDMELFKRVYRHVFVCAKEKGQKAVSLENALTYWQILFSPPGKPWASESTDWLNLWSEYLTAKWTKSVNKDMWNQTFEFSQKALSDETLSFWSEDSAWPGVIDDFVIYAKEKRGDVPARMEID